MKKHFWLGLAVVALLLAAAAFYGYHEWGAKPSSTRNDILTMMPADARAVLFVELKELRGAPFFTKLLAWAPKPQADPEYAQFIKETGFDYERDLDRIAIAFEKQGQDSGFLVVADGKFDESKISAFAIKNGTASKTGGRKIFSVPVSGSAERTSLIFLRSNRIAVTNETDAANALAGERHERDTAEWRARFERLAGSPVFAVIRQDAAAGSALGKAPGAFRSPQLSALLDQLQWVTIAAKPENDRLHVVAEGESLSEATTDRLADAVNGILTLVGTGLNDAKTRQQLDPALRTAYLELLKSADVSKIDRGDTKSVRLAFEITPAFLDAASRSPAAPPRAGSPKSVPGNSSRSKRGHT